MNLPSPHRFPPAVSGAILVALFISCTLGTLARAQSSSGLRDRHFVFITGYNSEKLPGYMDENMQTLRDEGADQVDQIRPPSETAILDNVPMIRDQLLALYESGGRRPLVIIAHSKAGLEVIHTLVRFGGLFPADVVERVFVAQSPLQGSPYTDHVMAEWDSSIFVWNPMYWLLRAQHAGFLSMMTSQSQADFARTAALANSDILASVSSRLFYLRSRKPRADVSASLQKSAAVVEPLGDNDGLVPTDRMLLKSLGDARPFGTDLGIEDGADHLDDFVLGPQPTPVRREKIRAFTRKLAHLASLPIGELRAAKFADVARLACGRVF